MTDTILDKINKGVNRIASEKVQLSNVDGQRRSDVVSLTNK